MFYNIISSRMKTILKWISVIVVAVAFFVSELYLFLWKTNCWKNGINLYFCGSILKWIRYFAPVHGATTDWSFLFDDNKSVEQNPIVNVNANNMDDESPTKQII